MAMTEFNTKYLNDATPYTKDEQAFLDDMMEAALEAERHFTLDELEDFTRRHHDQTQRQNQQPGSE